MLNRLTYFCTVFTLAAMMSACDSTDEDTSDSELILGAWRVAQVTDALGDQTGSLDSLGTLTVEFVTNQYTIQFDAAGDGEDRTESGAYSLDDVQKVISLQVEVLGQPIPVPFSYAFRSEDRLELSIENGIVINQVLGSDFEGRVTLTLERD